MKPSILIYGAAITVLVTIFSVNAGVIVGPITNLENGHDYYLLTQNTWTASEAEAETLGGTLAVITNPANQKWVYSRFSGYLGINRILWIGLHRAYPAGPFTWINGEPTNYSNWLSGQPDNSGGVEDCGAMWSPNDPGTAGTWNDERDSEQNYGVVEVTREKSLSEQEKTLIGPWFQGGRIDKPCYCAGTSNMVFAIGDDGRSASIIDTSDRHIFAPGWHESGEIIPNKILWSDGTWWSRQASSYTSGRMPRKYEIMVR